MMLENEILKIDGLSIAFGGLKAVDNSVVLYQRK
jgi:ABC-type uncharacterized transport system ATPase subunit